MPGHRRFPEDARYPKPRLLKERQKSLSRWVSLLARVDTPPEGAAGMRIRSEYEAARDVHELAMRDLASRELRTMLTRGELDWLPEAELVSLLNHESPTVRTFASEDLRPWLVEEALRRNLDGQRCTLCGRRPARLTGQTRGSLGRIALCDRHEHRALEFA